VIELDQILEGFIPIHLDEMESVRLMDRVDTKFAFELDQLPEVLSALKQYYRVLEVQGKRISQYKSLYFDKKDFDFFNDHHNAKDHRFKVRYRNYVDSSLFFLEVKEKKRGRVSKMRIPVEKIEENLSLEEQAFIEESIREKVDLEPKLWSDYNRITLVNNEMTERLTLDTSLVFRWENETKTYNDIVIAELKQERVNRRSPFYKVMKTNHVRPYRLSKYCIGAIELHTKKKLKYNRFKSKLLKLKKLNNDH